PQQEQQPERVQPSTDRDRILAEIEEKVGRGRDRPSSTPLNAKEREWLAGQDPAVQQQVEAMVRRLEAANQAGFQSYKDKAANGNASGELEALLAPRRASFKQNGHVSDAAALKHLFSFSDAFERDPVGLSLHLLGHMQQKGVNLQPIAAAFGQQYAQPAQITEQQLQDYVGMQ